MELINDSCLAGQAPVVTLLLSTKHAGEASAQNLRQAMQAVQASAALLSPEFILLVVTNDAVQHVLSVGLFARLKATLLSSGGNRIQILLPLVSSQLVLHDNQVRLGGLDRPISDLHRRLHQRSCKTSCDFLGQIGCPPNWRTIRALLEFAKVLAIDAR